MNWTTHQVTNQVPDLVDYNLYRTDRILQEAVMREGAHWHDEALDSYGRLLGRSETQELAREANRRLPELEAFDRLGRRCDRVNFHPSWHALMRMAFDQGLHSSAWSIDRGGVHVARAATFLLHGQAEAGTLCPLTMTSASIPVLRQESWFEDIRPLLYSRQYDDRDLPVTQKTSMTIGMGMTEKQGGSDLRSNTTQAAAVGAGGRGGEYRLTGHKWFFSSPMSDAHLVLAQHEDQFSCFYVPRWRPDGDGKQNSTFIQRLKNKLGNASNASAEVEFKDAFGILVAEPGRGIATLLKMAGYTRLDCVLGSTALLRQALVQALHHARHRNAFGKPLIEHGLLRCVLADLALETEAATALALRLAAAFDAADSPLEKAYRRIVAPAAKFWVCKRTIEATAECMEVWGGNGYIEDAPMPRLYREAPVNSIWEGSGNVVCLDVLRALKRYPEWTQALQQSLVRDSEDEPLLRESCRNLLATLAQPDDVQACAARYVAQELVLLVQANLLRRHAPQPVSDRFIQSRFAGRGGRVFGVVADKATTTAILHRAWQE